MIVRTRQPRNDRGGWMTDAVHARPARDIVQAPPHPTLGEHIGKRHHEPSGVTPLGSFHVGH